MPVPSPTTDARMLLATYADDTALLSSFTSQLAASAAVQDWLRAMERWTKQWNIAINCCKSACVTFSLRLLIDIGHTFNGDTIRNATSHCYLGVHLDHRLI
ncbi:hypothetical protein KR032_002576 [Drosophila birchii]|nr:hypothetical protein KR032_002576 [Drosophila birchii]